MIATGDAAFIERANLRLKVFLEKTGGSIRQPLNDNSCSSAASSGSIALVSRWTKCPIPASGGRS
jgi:hypothetical protein